MFTKTIITKSPNGKFIFVGRVPASLMGKSFENLEDAKIATIDNMIETGDTYPVDVQCI
jgi:hypothetical protein